MEPVKATFRPRGGFVPNPKLPLREQVHEVMRFKQFSLRTERAYWGWMKQFLVFCRDHPHLTPALAQAQTLTRPLATLSHPMGEVSAGRMRGRAKGSKRELFRENLTPCTPWRRRLAGGLAGRPARRWHWRRGMPARLRRGFP